jgi:hypothetical protein
MTADTIGVSTRPQIRNRTPVLNSISTTPCDVGKAVIRAATFGTSSRNDPNRSAPCSCLRQRNSWLACIPAWRATADATAPGVIAAARMRSFWALDHLRRGRTKAIHSPGLWGAAVIDARFCVGIERVAGRSSLGRFVLACEQPTRNPGPKACAASCALLTSSSRTNTSAACSSMCWSIWSRINATAYSVGRTKMP